MASNARAALENNRKKDMAATALQRWTDERVLESDAASQLVRAFGVEVSTAGELIAQERSKRALKK